MRVREWYLDELGALYRQTILFSRFASAEMNALMNRSCCNWAGKFKVGTKTGGVLSQINTQVMDRRILSLYARSSELRHSNYGAIHHLVCNQ